MCPISGHSGKSTSAERIARSGSFDLIRLLCQGAGAFCVFVGTLCDLLCFALAKLAPSKIIEGSGRVRDAPMRHCASGIGLESPKEALYALLLVEAEGPVQPKIKPALRFCRERRDKAPVAAYVERVRFGRRAEGGLQYIVSHNRPFRRIRITFLRATLACAQHVNTGGPIYAGTAKLACRPEPSRT